MKGYVTRSSRFCIDHGDRHVLWLPSESSHIFQRPAQLGVGFYKDVGRERNWHTVAVRHAFSSRMHIEDLIEVEHQLVLGTRSRCDGTTVDLPSLPRASLAMARARFGAPREVHRCPTVGTADAVHVTPLGQGPRVSKMRQFFP